MSTRPSNSAADADSATGASAQKAVQVRVHAQYVKDLSFETPTRPQSIGKGSANIEMSIDVHAESQQALKNSAEVTLKIQARAKHEESVLFILELAYAGIFELINAPPGDAEPVFMIEAPRQLFPFARRMVADLTREGGFPPLLIDPIDFTSLYLSQRNKEKAGSAEISPAH